MEKNFPSIPWKEYFLSILPAGIVISDEERVDVQVPFNYLAEYENIINTTSKRVQANYALLRVIYFSIDYCFNEKIRIRTQQYEADEQGGPTKVPARWKQCLDFINPLFMAMDALYVRKYFNQNDKREAMKLVNAMRKQFYFTLRKVRVHF